MMMNTFSYSAILTPKQGRAMKQMRTHEPVGDLVNLRPPAPSPPSISLFSSGCCRPPQTLPTYTHQTKQHGIDTHTHVTSTQVFENKFMCARQAIRLKLK